MKRLVVVGSGSGPSRLLRQALEEWQGCHVDWLVDLSRLPAALAISPAPVVLLVTGPEGPELIAPAERLCRGLGRPPLLVAIVEGDPTEEELRRLPEVAELFVAPLRPIEVRARLGRLFDREAVIGTRRTCAEITERLGLAGMIGENPVFVAIKAKLPLIAHSEATVVISGETGTGKEVVAQAIHHLSRRSHAPFLPVNCGAIPTELFENELFGHQRGAFTDARASAAGLIAEAEGGTLFLDEVDAIPLLAQTKLLRFLQDQVYRPLGSPSARRADVRIIAATNADLDSKVARGSFREDLYYRLNTLPLTLPPLRERGGDILLLATHFFRKVAGPGAKTRWRFELAVAERLRAYAWPGNVRELENLVQEIVALNAPGPVGLEMLPSRFHARTAVPVSPTFREAKALAVAGFEREYTCRLLKAHGGNVTRAARAAGKDRRTFGRLVKKYALDRANGSSAEELRDQTVPPRGDGAPPSQPSGPARLHALA